MTDTHQSSADDRPIPDRFEPSTVEAFRYVSRFVDLRTGHAELRYALDGLEFVEKLSFPIPAAGVTPARAAVTLRLLDHLWLVAGLSYYKLAAPPAVKVEAGEFHRDDIDLHRLLLRRGLGEFCFVNGLEPELTPSYEFSELSLHPAPVTSLHGDRGPLVPVGGGKDSCVTIEALRHEGMRPTLITVRRFPIIADVIAASGLEDLHVERTLDPAVRILNQRGALNGHVPATAIVSFAALMVAATHGFDSVVMSNERSASEGNVTYRNVDINHQWSKSDEAEAAIAAAVGRITTELAWFSLLRPLSELHISRLFADRCARYFDSFSSCNRSQVIDGSQRVGRWCGRCPKCQFVYLALAAVMPRGQLGAVFGEDLFVTSPVAGFRSLLGLADWKPFECVGESLECRVALSMLIGAPAWAGHGVLTALAAEVRSAGRWPDGHDVADVFTPGPAPAIPTPYAHVLKSLDTGAAH